MGRGRVVGEGVERVGPLPPPPFESSLRFKVSADDDVSGKGSRLRNFETIRSLRANARRKMIERCVSSMQRYGVRGLDYSLRWSAGSENSSSSSPSSMISSSYCRIGL